MIPKFMKDHGRFCLWKLVMKSGKTKLDKIPYQLNGIRADATNPQHYHLLKKLWRHLLMVVMQVSVLAILILMAKISDERFARMSATYDAEQKKLEQRQTELQEFIDKSKEQTLNVDSFLKVVRKYIDITELTAEIIRSFVERIDVYKPEKVPGTRTKKQTICIHWNIIGAVDIPADKEKTAYPTLS